MVKWGPYRGDHDAVETGSRQCHGDGPCNPLGPILGIVGVIRAEGNEECCILDLVGLSPIDDNILVGLSSLYIVSFVDGIWQNRRPLLHLVERLLRRSFKPNRKG